MDIRERVNPTGLEKENCSATAELAGVETEIAEVETEIAEDTEAEP